MTDVRPAIVLAARGGVEHHDLYNYAEVRPMALFFPTPSRHWTGDCSSAVRLWYWMAGAVDPFKLGYADLEGYTGTELSAGSDIEVNFSRMLNNAQQIEVDKVLPGDPVVYGPGTGWHTALCVENPGTGPENILTVSMGQQGDPSYVTVGEDGRMPQTFLRFATNSRFPAPPPKPVPPVPKGKPTAADLTKNNLVKLTTHAQVRKAVTNKWALWYWAETKFEPQIGHKPVGVPLYANRLWREKRP